MFTLNEIHKSHCLLIGVAFYTITSSEEYIRRIPCVSVRLCVCVCCKTPQKVMNGFR